MLNDNYQNVQMTLKHLTAILLLLGCTTVLAKPVTVMCRSYQRGSTTILSEAQPLFFVVDSEAQTLSMKGVRLNAEWTEVSIMMRGAEKVFVGVPVIKRSFVVLLGRHDGSFATFREYRTEDGTLIALDELEKLARARGIWKPEIGDPAEGIAPPTTLYGKCEPS